MSELIEELWKEYERLRERNLSGFDVVYLFINAFYESLRQVTGMKEAILFCWAISSGGHKILLHIGLGDNECHDSCVEFFRHMQRRGMRMELLVNSDGVHRLIKVIE